MKNLFDFFRRKPKPDMPAAEEFSCDDVYALIDQFAEMVRRGEDAAYMMPLVEQHLSMCPDCREAYEALLRMMDVPITE